MTARSPTSELFLPRCSAGTAAVPGGAHGWRRPAALDVTDEAIPRRPRWRGRRAGALISAPAEAQVTDRGRRPAWFHLDHRELLDTTPDPEALEVLDGLVPPVLTLVGPDADEGPPRTSARPAGTSDGIRFMGSAEATQLSVTLSKPVSATES